MADYYITLQSDHKRKAVSSGLLVFWSSGFRFQMKWLRLSAR